MSRSLLLRLFIVLGLLLGNLALWVPTRATAAIPSDYSCAYSDEGWICSSIACNGYMCCDDPEGDCDD